MALASIKAGAITIIVYGVKHASYREDQQRIVTVTSFKKSCLAAIVNVIYKTVRTKHEPITTIHDVTKTQTIEHHSAKVSRCAQLALNSLIPTTPRSVKALTLINTERSEKLHDDKVRLQLLSAFLTDCIFEVGQLTTAGEVKSLTFLFFMSSTISLPNIQWVG